MNDRLTPYAPILQDVVARVQDFYTVNEALSDRNTRRRLIGKFHPDLWPDNPLTHELTVELNRLRGCTSHG